MEFSRQEYWSGLPFLLPGDLVNPEVEPMSPVLADGFFTTEPLGKVSFLLRLLIPSHHGVHRMTSPKPNYFPKAPPPKTFILELVLQHEFGGRGDKPSSPT